VRKAISMDDLFPRFLPFLFRKPQRCTGKHSLSSAQKSPHHTSHITRIRILEQVDVGYGKFSQAVVARIEEGANHLLSGDVFVKFYDPFYINPDDLDPIGTYLQPFSMTLTFVAARDNPSLTESDSSNDDLDVNTLARSVEDLQKSPKSLEEKKVCNHLSRICL
jgi:hypothetical protein